MFCDGCGRTDFPGGDGRAMLESLQRLAALPDADGTQLVLDQIHKYMKK